MKKSIAIGVLFMLMAVACSSFAQPTPTAIPTSTLTPVLTVTAPITPTNTALPLTQTPQAAIEWEGIPIMPGAMTGEGDEEGYVFTIIATPQQVQEYYQLELGKLGWQALAADEDDSSLMLVFMNDTSATLTVSLIAQGDAVLVLLGKLN